MNLLSEQKSTMVDTTFTLNTARVAPLETLNHSCLWIPGCRVCGGFDDRSSTGSLNPTPKTLKNISLLLGIRLQFRYDGSQPSNCWTQMQLTGASGVNQAGAFAAVAPFIMQQQQRWKCPAERGLGGVNLA